MLIDTQANMHLPEAPQIGTPTCQTLEPSCQSVDPTEWEKLIATFQNVGVDQLPSFASTRWGMDRVSYCSVQTGDIPDRIDREHS